MGFVSSFRSSVREAEALGGSNADAAVAGVTNGVDVCALNCERHEQEGVAGAAASVLQGFAGDGDEGVAVTGGGDACLSSSAREAVMQ